MRLPLVFSLFVTPLVASIYQWFAPVAPPAAEPAKTATAYLWIPPDCHRVCAVVVGQHNMIEDGFDDEGFRRTLSELGFALVWITPGADVVFRFDLDASERFAGCSPISANAPGIRNSSTPRSSPSDTPPTRVIHGISPPPIPGALSPSSRSRATLR